MTILSVDHLNASYGSVDILHDVKFSIGAAEIVVVLGRNGVGKTTLMKALIGLLPPRSGHIQFNGKEIRGLPPHLIAQAGIAYVPQGRGIFPKLTVEENLRMGTRARADGVRKIKDEVYDYFPILAERRSQLGGTLSGGQQQQLAIGRALCGNPQLLLLDEPSEGIQPNIVHQIGAFLREICSSSKVSVLLVEQNLDLGLSAAHRCFVMDDGRIVYEGEPDDFRDEEFTRKYLAI